MKRIPAIASGAIILFAASAAIACDYPERPHIPDGNTASKEELLAAKADVTGFLNAVDEYLRCVESEEHEAIQALEDPDPEVVKNRNDMLNKKFDAANEEKALVGEQFNQQVRAFNAKQKSE